jgi:adenylosuccinate synthase
MVYEHSKGNKKIGSTLKGIGPAYTDKVARCGLRLSDAREPDFSEKYSSLKEVHMQLVRNLGFDKDSFPLEQTDFDQYESQWFAGLDMINSLTHVEGEIYLNNALDQGVRVLAEGAQGTLLDIDFGSYPFVTSSNTIAAGACTGLGLAPSRIGDVIGIFKAYCTRVGSGPFPTELFDQDGDRMRANGHEFGSTTGRPRRCGWLDLPALKYAVMLNGVTRLIMTKADVISDFDTIQVCTAYQFKGKEIDYMPSVYNEQDLTPVYVTMKGWKTDIRHVNTMKDLPSNLLEYIRFIENYVGVDIAMVSTGPDRKHTIQ